MSSILVVSHHVFLTREQRYALQVPESEIEVVGSCSPVWMKDGEHETRVAEEVFAKYRFRHCPEPEKHTITFDPEGFIVRLSPHMPIHLTDVKDGGSMCIVLTHKNSIDVKDEKHQVIHFLDVEDMHVLQETLC